jgi:hypothetical protein
MEQLIHNPHDIESFVKTLLINRKGDPPPELDSLKILPVPTVNTHMLIQCFYFLEVHVCYEESFTTK